MEDIYDVETCWFPTHAVTLIILFSQIVTRVDVSVLHILYANCRGTY